MENNILYQYSGIDGKYNLPNSFELRCFKPSLNHLMLSFENRTGFAFDYHNYWVELRWAVATFFKYRIYYVLDNNRIIHTSYCSTKTFKFPFMKRNDWHIGPCYTDAEYRGMGIYPSVLQKVSQDLKEQSNNLYMIIKETNISSSKGVGKAGFKIISKLSKSKYLKIYRISK